MTDAQHVQPLPGDGTHLRTLIRLRWMRFAAQPSDPVEPIGVGHTDAVSVTYRRAA